MLAGGYSGEQRLKQPVPADGAPEEQARRLTRLAQDDPALRKEVEEILLGVARAHPEIDEEQ